MRPLPPLLAALPLLVLAAPGVAAEPVAQVYVHRLWYEWTVGDATGVCDPSERVHVTAQRVNSRLLATIETGTRRVHTIPSRLWPGSDFLPDASCPMQLTALPGAWVNPCNALAMEPQAPATTLSDPYFHRDDRGDWVKRLAYADGGHVHYKLVPEDSYGPGLPLLHLAGSCASPGASVRFHSLFMPAVAGA